MQYKKALAVHSKGEASTRDNREKQARKNEKEKKQKIRKKRGNIKSERKWRVGRKTKSEKARSVVGACINRLLPSLPLNSLLSGKNSRISHLGPFFQSEQFS